jgi:hypothetical protein
MPANKDFKRLVRARMRKTGEAYTAARAQLLQKTTPVKPAPAAQPKPDYAKLAGVSDATIEAQTGCTWEKWVFVLDKHGADKLSHRDLADLIKTKYKTADWWTQNVAVGYERIRGLRVRGQRRDGSYSGNKSRTFNVPVDRVFEAWSDSAQRKQWMTPSARVRTAQTNKSIRLGLSDGAIIAAWFTA